MIAIHPNHRKRNPSWTDEPSEEEWEEQEEYSAGEDEFSEEVRQPWTEWDPDQVESVPDESPSMGPDEGEEVRPLPPRPSWDRQEEDGGGASQGKTPWERRKKSWNT